ncbi:hypothetical protein TSUD_166650 [Trifolium subterraneum]|uniref:Uncharacterized protein n=1 Tax=Trifolium subterraneum TaxID=3900 RepID=A0A2Z6ML50_TRISU|nr:hypothetical protein TSUD_166650 [Trifolium subterraneum]
MTMAPAYSAQPRLGFSLSTVFSPLLKFVIPLSHITPSRVAFNLHFPSYGIGYFLSGISLARLRILPTAIAAGTCCRCTSATVPITTTDLRNIKKNYDM